MTRLDKHDHVHHELFDENTAAIGGLGDIVDKHAGDALFFAPDGPSLGGVDAGETDFEAEMLDGDPLEPPNNDAEIDREDVYSDAGLVWATDQTGSVEGIARGFGTHLPQDLGRDGFHVEEIPDAVLSRPRRVAREGEELDDYDDVRHR